MGGGRPGLPGPGPVLQSATPFSLFGPWPTALPRPLGFGGLPLFQCSFHHQRLLHVCARGPRGVTHGAHWVSGEGLR